MQKSRRDIQRSARAPFLGMLIIVLAVLCLIIFLGVIMIFTRVFLG